MSGDATGVILALLFTPLAIWAAAAAGVAYAAVKVGGFLVKSAVGYAAKKKQEHDLIVSQCSGELEALYSKMQLAVNAQADAFEQMAKETEKQLSAAAKNMQAMAETAGQADLAALNAQMDAAHKTINAEMAKHTQKVQQEILAPGRKELLDCAKALDAVKQTREELELWKKQTADAKAMQQSMAYNSLRDALASLKMMEKLTRSSGSETFKTQYANLKKAYTSAHTNYKNGLFEAAYSGSRTVIREVAMQVAAQQADQMELDFASMELQARIEGLITEMKARRIIEIPGRKKATKRDLNDFSQGKYSEMQKMLENKLAQAQGAKTLYEIQKLRQEFDNILEPRAQQIAQVAQQVLHGYQEKLKVLEIVKDVMEQQNYAMDWAAPAGDDLSQKLVVHFTNRSGATISVTLDNNAAAGDVAKMAMELLTFYEDGRPVSEAKKKDLRDKLNAALKDAGVMGGISCTGNVNQPSSQTEMSTVEGVLNEKPKAIL